jgi:NTP pyrophosphatase (non-canonical NTP hydrolase)
MAEPTDENLQKLCSLLDILDAWVVQGWDSHPDRRRTLSRLRGEAGEVRQAVEARNRSRSAERAAAAKAKKAAAV